MPSLNSDKIEECLRRKMKATFKNSKDKIIKVYNLQDELVATTALSNGPKQNLGPGRVNDMAKQLNLSTYDFVELVSCRYTREQGLEKMVFE